MKGKHFFGAFLHGAHFFVGGITVEIYRVSFIGHRKLYEIGCIEQKLNCIVRDLLSKKEYVEFYVGRNGDFDILTASAVKNMQKVFGKHNSSLILVLPYHVKDEEYYKDFYDEIYLPLNIKTHFKEAITKRNEWMIDNSDLLISYVKDQHGGAWRTEKYAKIKEKQIMNIADGRA